MEIKINGKEYTFYPELVDFETFLHINFSSQISTDENVNWSDVLGVRWARKSDEENYEEYKKWWLRNNSKLGKALK